MGEIIAFAALLQQKFPQMQVIDGPSLLLDYAVNDQVPGLIVRPRTQEEAAATIRLSSQHRLTVLARGNGTHIDIGNPPEQLDILLEMTALDRLLEHEAPDLTCRVEAGIALGQLQMLLATKGQWLALDPPNADFTTIGGLLATNASGPKRLRYGTARDLVIGLHTIQANGEIARSGGNVVKNVAGYDLNKLYIGSLGTLGVIVEASFKLHPLPQVERTLLFSFVRCEDAVQTTLALLRSPLQPSAIELLAIKRREDTSFNDFALPDDGYTLAVDFENSTIGIERQITETLTIANTHHAFLRSDLEGQEQERFWQRIKRQMQGALTCKISIHVSQLAPYVHLIESTCKRHHLTPTIVAHAGNGILYVELSPYDAVTQATAAIAELRTHAQDIKGSLVVEHCPTQMKQHLSVWGEPRADFYLMQRLKQQFDPGGLFVRGRYLGGL